jgi:hypothetical protein
MSKIKNNSILKGLQGKFGETHTYKKIRGKVHMVGLPDMPDEPTEKQKAVRERFARAAGYASAMFSDPMMKAEYEKGINAKKNTAYLVALSDSLNAPKVKEIKASDYLGVIGNDIRVVATDDFKVVRLRVIVKGSDGRELERGDAAQDVRYSDTWHYAATVSNPVVAGSTISVTAFDFADNETTLERVL